MSGFLLDTNVVSELIKPKPEAKLAEWVDSTEDELFHLSVLSIGEIRRGIVRLQQGRPRLALETWLETELKSRFSGRILAIDEAIAERWGALDAEASARGIPVPIIDGLLAATALHHNLILVTRNIRDVTGTGVVVFNPWES